MCFTQHNIVKPRVRRFHNYLTMKMENILLKLWILLVKNRHLKSMMLYLMNIDIFSEKVKALEAIVWKIKNYFTGALNTLYDKIYQSYAILNTLIIRY